MLINLVMIIMIKVTSVKRGMKLFSLFISVIKLYDAIYGT